MSVSRDGDNSEWKRNTDAFFLGSDSQAQCSFRFAHDADSLYLLVDCLDSLVAQGDKLEIYFSDGVLPASIKKTVFEAQGSAVATLHPGIGYVAELSWPKSALPFKDASIFFNAVLKKGELSESFNFRSATDPTNWFEIRL